MRQKNLYIQFLIINFVLLFGGGFYIFGISVRLIYVFLFFVYVYYIKAKLFLGKIEKIYVYYLILLLSVSLINQEIFTYAFWQTFINYHIVSIVIVLSLPLLIKTRRRLDMFLSALFVLYILNTLMSFGEYNNNPIAWGIVKILHPRSSDEIERLSEYLFKDDNVSAKSVVMGLSGHPVDNGYFATVFLPILTYKLGDVRNKLFSCWREFIVLLSGFCVIFMCQQRTGFALFFVYIFILLMFRYRDNRSLLLILFLVAIISLFSLSFQSFDMGRLTTVQTSDARLNQLFYLSQFFNSDDFIFGGNTNKHLFYIMGHNTIMDSLRRGGLFLLLFYIMLLLYYCCYFFRSLIIEKNIFLIFCALACLIYIAYSFLHSNGIQSGAVFFWFLYSLSLIEKDEFV